MKISKALVAPINNEGQILLQDREGFLPPPWGYFGGSVEKGETTIEAAIREIEEELRVKLKTGDLMEVGKFVARLESGKEIVNFVYIWRINHKLDELKLNEGKAMKYVDFDEAKRLLTFGADKEILEAVKKMVGSKKDKLPEDSI